MLECKYGSFDENTEVLTRRVYTCSGCADVGELADKAGRKLRKSGFADPGSSCLVGIGAHIESFIKAANDVDEVITIDGCPMLCAKKIMEQANITPISYVLTELGFKKGQTLITDEVVAEAASKIEELHKNKHCNK
jgi:uncharacterized metal-binding protein